jgi:hypothetical protein
MDVFHVVLPVRHVAVIRDLLKTKLPDRDDIFMWTCSPRTRAEPMCAACESIPEDMIKYVYMIDPEKFERFFFWRVDPDSGLLQETNCAASTPDLGSKVYFKDCVASAGYRIRRWDG